MRRDLRFLLERVGRLRIVVALAGCAITGALVGAGLEVARQYGLPLAPKGEPPS